MTTKNRALTALAAAALLAPVLAACGADDDAAAGDRLLVATTVAPITSITSAVAGDLVDVRGIVPEGTNSHTFEPAPKVAELLSDADVVLVNGLMLEDPTLEMAEANMKDDAVLVKLGDEVLPQSEWLYDFSFPEEDGKPNPHLWTDPTYAKKYADVVESTLAAADPDNAEAFAANNEKFQGQVDALAKALRADQESIDADDRTLLTYHDAYAYFAKNFDWTVVGAVQPKDFADPSAKEVARIIDQVKSQGVRTIFGSEVFPSGVLEQIGEATGARYEDTLRDDDLPGAPGDVEHSWLGLMRYNYVTMIEGLGGKADRLNDYALEASAVDEAEYPQ